MGIRRGLKMKSLWAVIRDERLAEEKLIIEKFGQKYVDQQIELNQIIKTLITE